MEIFNAFLFFVLFLIKVEGFQFLHTNFQFCVQMKWEHAKFEISNFTKHNSK